MKTLVTYVPGRDNYSFRFIPPYKGEKVNIIETDIRNRISNINTYGDKLQFAREQGCDNLSIVGYGEPLLNRSFLELINTTNNSLEKPFKWIELKTNGSLLARESKESDNNFTLLQQMNVKTLVLRLTDFDTFKHNKTVGGNSADTKFDIKLLCEKIKEYGFNLRVELYIIKWLDYITLDEIMRHVKELNLDQITLKNVLIYKNSSNSEVLDSLRTEGPNEETINRLQQDLQELTPIGVTTTGYPIYSIENVSVVLDDGSHLEDDLGNLYLLPNSKIYRRPDDLGSLIF